MRQCKLEITDNTLEKLNDLYIPIIEELGSEYLEINYNIDDGWTASMIDFESYLESDNYEMSAREFEGESL